MLSCDFRSLIGTRHVARKSFFGDSDEATRFDIHFIVLNSSDQGINYVKMPTIVGTNHL